MEFAVEETREVGETVSLANDNETRLRFFAAGPYLSEKTRRFLAELGELMAQRSTLQRQINEGQEQMRRLAEEEAGCGRTSRPCSRTSRRRWSCARSG